MVKKSKSSAFCIVKQQHQNDIHAAGNKATVRCALQNNDAADIWVLMCIKHD